MRKVKDKEKGRHNDTFANLAMFLKDDCNIVYQSINLETNLMKLWRCISFIFVFQFSAVQ